MKNKSIIDKELKEKKADAWIIVDYENKNPSTVALVGKMMLTRKVVFVVGKDKSLIICHSIDSVFLNVEEVTRDFELCIYNTWQELLDLEKRVIGSFSRVLMDVSENGLLPRVSLADYGSVEYIKQLGVEVISSADLLQTINASYDSESFELQVKACNLALQIKDEAFTYIGDEIRLKGETDEYAVQQFICRRFREEGMVYDEEPIVAIGPNASNPHYGPTQNEHSPIKEGDLVLIDMWAKIDDPKAVYADITWMAFIGETIPPEASKRFSVLKTAIDKAFDYLTDNYSTKDICGWEVDRLVRDYISDKGYGKYFTHRTGHNISVDNSPHGPGANIDDYESHDTRRLIEGTSFSLEPGIYAQDFGMRSETNVAIHNGRPMVVAGRQQEITKIIVK